MLGCAVLLAGEVPDRGPALVAGVVVGSPPLGAIPGVWVPPGIVARPVFAKGEVGVVGCGVLVVGEVPDRAAALVAGIVTGCPPAELVPVVGWPALGELEAPAGVVE